MLEVNVCTPLYFLRIIKSADYTTPSWYLHVSSKAPAIPNMYPALGKLSFVISFLHGDKTSPPNTWSPAAFKRHLKATHQVTGDLLTGRFSLLEACRCSKRPLPQQPWPLCHRSPSRQTSNWCESRARGAGSRKEKPFLAARTR